MNASMKKAARRAAAGVFLSGLMAQAAHAAIDVTAVTAGITEAETAILAVLGALMGLSIAVFGLSKIQRFLSRRAGA